MFAFLTIIPQRADRRTKAAMCDHREAVNVKTMRVIIDCVSLSSAAKEDWNQGPDRIRLEMNIRLR